MTQIAQECLPSPYRTEADAAARCLARIGAAFVTDPRIAGVACAVSTEVARAIARSPADDRATPARPRIPLIAETGGNVALLCAQR